MPNHTRRTAPPWRGIGRLLFATTIAVIALPAVAGAQPPAITDPASPNAQALNDLYQIIFWLAVAMFVFVEGLILYAALKFRRREGDDSLPAQSHGNNTIEVVWTVIPALIVLVITGLSYRTMMAEYNVPADAIQVNATGHRWWWEFEYPSAQFTTATEMVVPVGKPVQVMLDSPEVLHSFWVPQLAGKRDAVPGDKDAGFGQNNVWFVANKPGRFAGQCAELCGAQHAGMRFTVIAMPEADYEAWLTEMAKPAPVPPAGSAAARGLEIISKKGCQGCHVVGGVPAMIGKVGPNLTHVASRTRLAGEVFENTPENLKKWLNNPADLKPATTMAKLALTPEEIDDAVAYLQTLK